MKISEKLFKLRSEKGLTLLQLSCGANVAVGTLCEVENGKHLPSLATLLKLSRFYDVNIYELLGENSK